MKNTKERGQFRFIIYKKSQAKNFTGVCLDLDIVEENENPIQLKQNLEEAAKGYLETVGQNNLNDELLNKQIPLKYIKIIERLVKRNFPLQDGQFFTKNINDLVCA